MDVCLRSLFRREGDDFHFYKYLQGEVPEGSGLGEVVSGDRAGSCPIVEKRGQRSTRIQSDRAQLPGCTE